MKKIWYLVIFLVVVGAMCSPFFAYAENVGGSTEEITALNKEIEARKTKIKELEETISKYRSNISQKQLQATSLKNQLGILDNSITQAQADVELTQEKIKQTELEIEALDISIKDKQAVMAKQKKIVTKIIQSLHANDQKNYLEILLTNNSFADFYNQAKYLENVYVDLGRSIKSLRIIKEDLDNRKIQADARRKTYEDLKKQLLNKRQDLAEQANEKNNLLVQTQSSEKRYAVLLDSMKKQYQIVESEQRTFEDQVRRKLEAQDKIQKGGEVALSWPTDGRYITAEFHDPNYPFRNIFQHSAIDIRAKHGTIIRAASSGYVAKARRCTTASCYAYVLIVHTGEISSVYGHMSSIIVNDNQFANRGDIIGYSGGTPGTVGAGPFVTGAHLHFEVRKNGIPVDPMNYLIQ